MAGGYRDNVPLFKTGARAEFMAQYDTRVAEIEPMLGLVATVIRDDKETLDFGWLGANPRLREWIGERQMRANKPYKFAITTREFEASIEFARKTVEDDQIGAAMTRMRQLANEAALSAIYFTIEEVYAKNATCYDGQPLFSTAHPESGANQSNRMSAGQTLSDANLQTAITMLETLNNDQGNPLGNMASHLIVGPKNRFAAQKILNSAQVIVSKPKTADASGELVGDANPLMGALDLIVSPYLTGAYQDYWYVADLTGEIKPAIFYERSDVPTDLTIITDPENVLVYKQNVYSAGVRRRMAFAAGAWQKAVGYLG